MRRSGRDPELVALPIEPAARALEQRLFGDVEEHDFAGDAREELRALLTSVQGDGPTEVSYGAGVFTDDSGLPVPEGVPGQIEALLRQSGAC